SPDKGWSPGAKWFVSKAAQGGLVLDLGVHMADLLRWIAGDVAEIAAYVDTRAKRIDVPDNFSALLRFESGATGVLELSWTIPCGGMLIEVYGTKGTLRHGFAGDRPLELIQPAGNEGRPRVSYPKPRSKAKNSQQCFLEAIRGKMASPTPGELGRDAVALCEAIAKSGETGRFVKVRRFPA
ncbi:MAG TPA: Gfo/Idh/MocA family oxidoreductase, partial [Candidatus Hydrogenedentes bacterium]|nr:Gfo/Idh/MocA family oxidoreductase [Candidatus Hydrogenedentota bacterium]